MSVLILQTFKSLFQLTIQEIYGDAALVHSLHVAKPSEAPPVEDGVHAVHVDALDFCV